MYEVLIKHSADGKFCQNKKSLSLNCEKHKNLLEYKYMEKKIPWSEFVFEAARASGPGGQKVNKTSSMIRLRWKVDDSVAFSDAEKDLIREKCRMTKDGDIIFESQEQRSQQQNKMATVERLYEMLAQALLPEKEWKKSKVPRREKEKRLEDKRRRAEVKKGRGQVKEY